MELIKKTILQALTTGKTGNDYIIIPDLKKNYYLKIGLVQKANDWGFFDAILPEYTGTTLTNLENL